MIALFQSLLVSVVPFLVVIMTIVVVHELGHFLTAKAFGVAIDRFAIGDREALHYNPDGSLDLIIQNEKPTNTANWLPVPKELFSLSFRLYWPREEILKGLWTPPAITPSR